MTEKTPQELLTKLDGGAAWINDKIEIQDEPSVRRHISILVAAAALEEGEKAAWARYLVRLIALELGAIPASIHELYMARGRGAVPPSFTVPAMNLRALSFDAARAVFRIAQKIKAGAFVFEIARSEIGYTMQRPAEYAANILGAAIAEGYQGPVFIQGDHFQVSATRYQQDPDTELDTVRALIREALEAGFFNIDVDTSTLVDLSKSTVSEQQQLNASLSAMFTHYIRKHEPDGLYVSVGGEIGEVGGRNSTEEELRAYVEAYQSYLPPKLDGLSKISVQTGTSHGGTVLADGSVADVAVDFEAMLTLSRVARLDYGTAGAVQHGASTLPESAFGKFVKAEACEVHLATNFQNMLFDRLPDALRAEMYDYLDEKHGADRKADYSDEQFYYKTRKNAIGPFKAQLWGLPDDVKGEICSAWEAQFSQLFELLAIADTRKYVDEFVKAPKITPARSAYFGEDVEQEEVGDLAD
ncbi:MAG: class II fructose-bisphosphate aldolase [Chloroflexi bacterium]|nr:class II fructose-bisphosphate aldolase [Chloroflexota bacterium]